MDKRKTQDLLYEQVARIGKAVSSPKRLALLELLAQGEITVDALAAEAGIDIKLASAHLKVLKAARLVEAQRDGRFIAYRLSGEAAHCGSTCARWRKNTWSSSSWRWSRFLPRRGSSTPKHDVR
jgi:DNA-binding transcriptional ArsR family regulator